MYERIKKKIMRTFFKGSYVPFTAYVFQDKRYKIGEFTYGVPHILFDDGNSNLTIGKFCSIAEGVTVFLGGNHRTDWISTYPFNKMNIQFPEAKSITGHPTTKGDVIIGSDVWIAQNVTILSGVTIGHGAVIGAGAVVSKNIGPYEIWAGNPAVFIKKRFDDETINKLLKLEWWNWETETIRQNVKLLCSGNISELLNKYAK